jgi:hypothetical protein
VSLWIVETNQGTRIVVYADDATAAVAGLSPNDRNIVRVVREWPKDAPFRVAFLPATPVDENGAESRCFWDGVSDWGEEPPPASAAALGDVHQAVRERDELHARLAAEHERGEHEPGALEACPVCFDMMLSEAMERRRAGRPRYDA